MSDTTQATSEPPLFTPLRIRDVTLPNRIVVSPMCQYSSADGFANDWHLVHLGTRAVGGAGLVMTEAASVTPDGRITPYDLGIWNDSHLDMLARPVAFIRAQGAVAGIQLAHAGQKASCARPWDGGRQLAAEEGGWATVAPSPLPFRPADGVPVALDDRGIADVVESFAAAAARARRAGFEVIEIHAAHGYLLHAFLSPLSNQRTDGYGGSFEARTRIVREVIEAVRGEWPESLPLFLRVSATDWADGGWDVNQTVALAREVASLGVDLIDCSTGGLVPGVTIPTAPGYQLTFADQVRDESGLLTGAVGLITDPVQANRVLLDGQADLVFLARQLLRDPYWPLRAARLLGATPTWPAQYLRAAD